MTAADEPGAARRSAVAARMAENLTVTQRSVAALGAAAAALDVLPEPALARATLGVEAAWRDVEREFSLLSAAEISRRAGSRAAAARSWASQKRLAGQLVGVVRRNRIVYPGFQLDATGAIRPAVPRVIAVLRGGGWSDEHIVLWFTAADGRLGGVRPVDELDGPPEPIVAAAEAAAVRW